MYSHLHSPRLVPGGAPEGTRPTKVRRDVNRSKDVVSAAFGRGPSGAPPALEGSKTDGVDHAHPVARVEPARGELRDHVEDLVREAADVENVVALGRLRRPVRLDVDADH